MRTELLAVVFRIWSELARPGEGAGEQVVAEGLVDAVLERSEKAPALGSHDEDLAAGAYWAWFESRGRLKPGHWVDPRTGKQVDRKAFGPWQTHHLGPDATAKAYARDFLWQLREGAKICPVSPAAPLSGSCHLARRLADRRLKKARELLAQAVAAF